MDFNRDLPHQQFQWAFFSMVRLNYRGMFQFPYHRKENLCKQSRPCGESLQHHYTKVKATNWKTISSPLAILKNPFQTNLIPQTIQKTLPNFTFSYSDLYLHPEIPNVWKLKCPPPKKKQHPKFSDLTCFFWKPCNLAIPHVDQLTAWPLPLAWWLPRIPVRSWWSCVNPQPRHPTFLNPQ